MNRNRFDAHFQKVSLKFPFAGYMDALVYYETKAIIDSLQLYLSDMQGLKLLDVGCGPMDKTALFQEIGFCCSAVDDLTDPWHLLNSNQERIIEFAKEMGIRFFHQKDGDYTIPFEKNSFDVVTCINVIEHLHSSPIYILNAMGRHLKPGGLLIVTMPNSVNFRKRISVLLGRTNYCPIGEIYTSIGEYRGHVREYTLNEIRDIIQRSGFAVVHHDTFEFIAQKRLPCFLRETYILLGKVFRGFRSGLLVIAQKPDNWKPTEEDPDEYFRLYPPPTRKNDLLP